MGPRLSVIPRLTQVARRPVNVDGPDVTVVMVAVRVVVGVLDQVAQVGRQAGRAGGGGREAWQHS